jgi:hypothetical protein
MRPNDAGFAKLSDMMKPPLRLICFPLLFRAGTIGKLGVHVNEKRARKIGLMEIRSAGLPADGSDEIALAVKVNSIFRTSMLTYRLQ